MDINKILEYISDGLDVSDSQMEIIKSAYNGVGGWLNADNSNIRKFGPIIYPQGSIALGTTVKPVGKDDEYDVDLVCLLTKLTTSLITPNQAKQLVGNRIKEHGKYKEMLDDEGRRCWTLKYSDNTKFHMDILPAVSESIDNIFFAKTPKEFIIDPIQATDKIERDKYEYILTNPKGFISWFRSRMELGIDKRIVASIQAIPEYPKKTQLQRSIQILKRHRDIMFENKDHKPISIIITTLAGQAYSGERDIISTITNILERMVRYIKKENGKYIVNNPVLMDENFCDKWNMVPEKADAFFSWIRQAREDFGIISTPNTDTISFSKFLGNKLDDRVVKPAFEKFSEDIYKMRVNGTLGYDKKTGILNPDSSNKIKGHTFYGEI